MANPDQTMLLDPIQPTHYFSFGRMEEKDFSPDFNANRFRQEYGRQIAAAQRQNASDRSRRNDGSDQESTHILSRVVDPDPIDPSACQVVRQLPLPYLLGQTERQQRLAYLNEFRDIFFRSFASPLVQTGETSMQQQNTSTYSSPHPNEGGTYYGGLTASLHHPPQQGSFEGGSSAAALPTLSSSSQHSRIMDNDQHVDTKSMARSPATTLRTSSSGTDDISTTGNSVQSHASSSRSTHRYEKPGSPVQQDRWDDRFEELKSFVRKHGHCHVPTRLEASPSLARCCKRQRYQYKLKRTGEHSTLTEEREQKLNDLNFVWDVHSSSWEERFMELVAFKMKYGHANVPRSKGKLGSWVKSQRRQHSLYLRGEKSHLTPGRVAKMNSLGFEWIGSKSPLPRDVNYGSDDSS